MRFYVSELTNKYKKKKKKQGSYKELEEHIERLSFEINNLEQVIDSGVTSESISNEIEKLKSERTTMRNMLESKQKFNDTELTLDDIKQRLNDDIKSADDLTIIRKLIRKVVVYNDKIKIYYNMTDDNNPTPDNDQEFFLYKFTHNFDSETAQKV